MIQLTSVRRDAVLLAVILLAGCDGGTKLQRVTGTVAYQGRPVEGAVVTFRCEAPAKTATGMTDAQGRFQLNTFPDGKGAVAGKHKVTVTKFSKPAGSTAPAASMDEMVKKPQATEAPKNLLPAKYEDPARSGFEFTVSSGGANDFKLELAD
jgi:hypothetical protein